MIKILETEHSINFVDDKNRLIGFDLRQRCCEDFGWAVTEEKNFSEESIAESIYLAEQNSTSR